MFVYALHRLKVAGFAPHWVALGTLHITTPDPEEPLLCPCCFGTWKQIRYLSLPVVNSHKSLGTICLEEGCYTGQRASPRVSDWHSMKNVALHCSLRWKTIILSFSLHHLYISLYEPFHSQELSISNFPCCLTRNVTSHSMEELGFALLIQIKKWVYTINFSLLEHFSLKRWESVLFELGRRCERVKRLGECTFWASEWKGKPSFSWYKSHPFSDFLCPSQRCIISCLSPQSCLLCMLLPVLNGSLLSRALTGQVPSKKKFTVDKWCIWPEAFTDAYSRQCQQWYFQIRL